MEKTTRKKTQTTQIPIKMAKYYLSVEPADLTSSIPRYNEFFDWKPLVTNAKYDPVYTTQNFIEYLPLQKDVLDVVARLDVNVPVFARQKASTASEFTVCSYKAMMETNPQFVYAMMIEGFPLHFYADFDLSLDETGTQTKNIVDAMTECIECMKIVITEEQQRGNASFCAFDGKFTLSLLYGHNPKKQSAHVVFHFTGLRMFHDVHHCRYFYNKILVVTQRRHPTKQGNPMYYEHAGKHVCIMDSSVYFKNKQFRLLGQRKNKPPYHGMLTPHCGTPELVCQSDQCIYHAFRQFTVQDYCANDPRFIPRNAEGVPFTVDILTLQETDNIDLKRNAAICSSSSVSMGGLSAMFTGSNMSFPSAATRSPITYQQSIVTTGDNEHDIATRARRVMHVVVTMLTIKTKNRCTLSTFDVAKRPESCIVGADSMWCPYKYMQKKKGMPIQGRVNEETRTIEHKSNHIGYTVRMALPLPSVHVSCTDPDCQAFLASCKENSTFSVAGNGSNEYARVRVDLSTISDEMQERYTEAVMAYMKNVNIPAVFLRATNNVNQSK